MTCMKKNIFLNYLRIRNIALKNHFLESHQLVGLQKKAMV